jgi:hypothetical protein
MADKIKVVNLANSIGYVISDEYIEDVIPALTMVLSHVLSTTDISIEKALEYIEQTLRIPYEPKQ